MLIIKPENLKPGMVLARDLLGKRNEVLLTSGQTLTAAHIAKLHTLEHRNAFIVDEFGDADEEPGLISRGLKRNTVNAVKTLFSHIEAGNMTGQVGSLNELRHYLDDIIDELSADKTMLFSMADIKVHDEYTYYHSVSVAALSILQGISMKMNRAMLYKLGMGALLHDVGKVFIPQELIQKPGALTQDEYDLMKRHSALGYDYLRKQWAGPLESVVAVLTHHERVNGSGYPLGLRGVKTPLEGKIIAISDVYDAMTSRRPYHEPILPSEAIEHIMGNSGILYDEKVVTAFVKKVVPYPIGSKVRLSDGRAAIVVETNIEGLMRPKVKLIHTDQEEVQVGEKTLDLLNDSSLWNITIIGIEK